MSLFCKKMCAYFLGNFWGKLGNFLLHHLVTLGLVGLLIMKVGYGFEFGLLFDGGNFSNVMIPKHGYGQ